MKIDKQHILKELRRILPSLIISDGMLSHDAPEKVLNYFWPLMQYLSDGSHEMFRVEDLPITDGVDILAFYDGGSWDVGYCEDLSFWIADRYAVPESSITHYLPLTILHPGKS